MQRMSYSGSDRVDFHPDNKNKEEDFSLSRS